MTIDEEKNSERVGKGVGFERTRRITGYLVGTTDRFNNAKKAELNDRVPHEHAYISQKKAKFVEICEKLA